MPAADVFKTPVGQSTLSRLPRSTPDGFISPGTRKLAGVTNSGSFVTPPVPNDDEREKKDRRRSKLLELQRRNLTSPATPSDRRLSAPLGGLNNVQLSEHYTNCIKLSTENKINAKNAFGLHLIDYMSQLLRKKDMDNFQVASSTLDASTKIYAGRVDAIHTETYKVLTGLGRGAEKNEPGEHGGEENDEQQPDQQQKKRRARKSNTVETNIKNLNVAKFDLEFDVDPFFTKTSATFDEGGTKGLLLNNLRCLDDTSQLLLDSNAVVASLEEERSSSQAEKKKRYLGLKDLEEIYAGVNLETMQICPAFSTFEFTNWEKDDDNTISSRIQEMNKTNHAFDLDAEPEPIPSIDDLNAMGDFAGEEGFGALDDDDDHDNADAASDCSSATDRSDHMLGGGKENQILQTTLKDINHMKVRIHQDFALVKQCEELKQEGVFVISISNVRKRFGGRVVTIPKDTLLYGYLGGRSLAVVIGAVERYSTNPRLLINPGHGTIGTLMQILASEPTDYSYFNTNLLRTWAGPAHWRLKPKSKDDNSLKDKDDKTFKKPKPKKEQFFIDYEKDINFERLFKETRASTTLTKATLDKYKKSQTTLPEDLHYEAHKLFRLFTKPKMMVKRQKTTSEDLDENIDKYDYNNARDRDNFCADVEGYDDDDDDNDGGVGFNFTADSDAAGSQDPFSTTGNTTMQGTMLCGDNLVSQPQKVAKIDIAYAKTAKKMDVRRLKASMWKLLVHEETDKGKASTSEPVDHVEGCHSFQTIMNKLPEQLSKNMAQNLSVHISLVCLLHLANEKKLIIKHTEEMSDLQITQA